MGKQLPVVSKNAILQTLYWMLLSTQTRSNRTNQNGLMLALLCGMAAAYGPRSIRNRTVIIPNGYESHLIHKSFRIFTSLVIASCEIYYKIASCENLMKIFLDLESSLRFQEVIFCLKILSTSEILKVDF